MNYLFFLLFLGMGTINLLSACPLCVGKVKPESPPFFSEDFYKPNAFKITQTKQEYGKSQFEKIFKSQKGK